MLKRLIALGSAAFLALTALAARADAAVVDTFSFSNSSGWSRPAGFSGQFTGTVEPDGLIGLADLSAFSLGGFVGGFLLTTVGKDALQFFSYDPKGGASSFGFVSFLVVFGREVGFACSGAPSVLDARCNPDDANPASTLANFAPGMTSIYSTDQTAVTLVSSVSSVPEPSTWAMMLIGLAGLGAIGARRSRPRPLS